MLTPSGCRHRVQQLRQVFVNEGPLLLGDPLHLRYFANCYVDPFHLSADFWAYLLIAENGETTLIHDNRLPASVKSAHADHVQVVNWYDGQTAGQGPRRIVLKDTLARLGTNGRIHDSLADPLAAQLFEVVHNFRRQKNTDEIDMLQQCMRVSEVGHAWARQNIQAGMTELDVYNGVFSACSKAAEKAVIVYGDFAVSPGTSRKGGPPTTQVLGDGDMFILDFSVILQGYRSDFTNTLVVGKKPNADQQRLYDLCLGAMQAGEAQLQAGTNCQQVYDAVRGIFETAGVADAFPHHAGHGLGLSHPEAPFFVRQSSETLLAGDVVTLEPGLYIDGLGGIRIEHNYLITDSGFQRLSNHEISFT